MTLDIDDALVKQRHVYTHSGLANLHSFPATALRGVCCIIAFFAEPKMGRRAQSSLQERFLGERVLTQSPLSRFGASGVPWKAHERLKPAEAPWRALRHLKDTGKTHEAGL